MFWRGTESFSLALACPLFQMCVFNIQCQHLLVAEHRGIAEDRQKKKSAFMERRGGEITPHNQNLSRPGADKRFQRE